MKMDLGPKFNFGVLSFCSKSAQRGHQILTFGNSEWQQEEKSIRQMGSTNYDKCGPATTDYENGPWAQIQFRRPFVE